MNIGPLFTFRNPPQWRQPFPAYYAEQLSQIKLAEQLGYEMIWLSEHHFSEDGYSPSLLPIIPKARFSPYLYASASDGSYLLSYVNLPPGGRCTYRSQAKAWKCEAD